MPDVQEVFRLATNKVKPDPDALERQVRRQRAEVRKSRVRAYIAVAAVLVLFGAAIFAISRVVEKNDTVPDDHQTVMPTLSFLPKLPPGAISQEATLLDANGKQSGTIAGLPLDAFALSVTPDGLQAAFVASPNEVADNQIGLMNTDGTGARFVATPNIDVGTVAISPDGSRIAFEGTVDGNTDIYVVNGDGTGLRRLTNDPDTDQFPAWAPNGTTIAYDNAGAKEQTDDPQYSTTAEIFTVSADGGPVTRITHNRGFDAAPSYSPDGKTIVDESFGGLSLMKPDGTEYRKLRVSTESAFTPRFSPDGHTIAYTYYSDAWRPPVQLGRTFQNGAALVIVATVDPDTRHVTDLSKVGMATDLNTPQWLDGNHMLIMRVPVRPTN